MGPLALAHHRGRAAGVGTRGVAAGEGRQRVVCRGERADRDGDDVYFRAGAVLSSRENNALLRGAGASEAALYRSGNVPRSAGSATPSREPG